MRRAKGIGYRLPSLAPLPGFRRGGNKRLGKFELERPRRLRRQMGSRP